MKNKFYSIGFIGGGRITRIILEGLTRKGRQPQRVIVSDADSDILSKLAEQFPEIETTHRNVKAPASADLVVIALHPPAVMGILADLKETLNPEALLISLAPKLSILQLSTGLGGFQRIVRMIPNAPSIINKGFNPTAFASSFSKEEKKSLIKWFEVLGDSPEVEEDMLEAYAVITAMGPTYFWFQLHELHNIGLSFGLSSKQVARGLSKMVKGTVKTFFESGLSPEEIMDLIPVKPLGEEEANIRNIYSIKLKGLYSKLKG